MLDGSYIYPCILVFSLILSILIERLSLKRLPPHTRKRGGPIFHEGLCISAHLLGRNHGGVVAFNPAIHFDIQSSGCLRLLLQLDELVGGRVSSTREGYGRR